jgi:hypothetical protein
MAGLVPAIHVVVRKAVANLSTRGFKQKHHSSEAAAPDHDVDTRHKAGHDADGVDQTLGLSAYAFSGTTPTNPLRLEIPISIPNTRHADCLLLLTSWA